MLAWECSACGHVERITIAQAMAEVTGALVDVQAQLEARLQRLRAREENAAGLDARERTIQEREVQLRRLEEREATVAEREARVGEKERRMDATPPQTERFKLLETE
jgi:hypothetical protein